MFSAAYNDQQTGFKALGSKRFTGRFNLDYKVSDKLELKANLALSRQRNQSYWNLNGGSPSMIALTRTPLLPIYDIDAQGNPQSSYLSLPGFMNGQDNPIAFVNSVSNFSNQLAFRPNFSATLHINRDLLFRTQAGIEFIGDDSEAFLPPEATGVIWNDTQFNRLQNRDNERRTFDVTSFLDYGKRLNEKLRIRGTVISAVNGGMSSNLTTEAYATATGQMRSLGAAAGYSTLNSSNGDYSSIKFTGQGQVFYGADDKYSVNFALTREGNSSFGPGNRWATFPTVGALWHVSSEPFMRRFKFLDELKFKASMGSTGRQPGGYQYISQFATGSAYGDFSGVSQQNPQLDNLRWETAIAKNIGFDMEMFKRFMVTLEFYENTSKNLLRGIALPNSSGSANTSMLVNLGDIRNRGVDFDFSYDAIKSKKRDGFNWTTMFNISHNVNKVTKLPGGTIRNTNNYARFSSQVNEGDALGSYYGLVYKGVYATDLDAAVKDADGNIVYELDGVTPRIIRVDSETGLPFKGGDAIYEDFNHDGIINAQDRVRVGNANPDFFGGFNNMFNYKGLGLSFFITFQYGNDLVNGLRYELERMDGVSNQGKSVLQRWRKQGDVTNMPRALRSDNRNTIGSTRWIEDGSYARLRTLTLSYRFPTDIAKRLKLRTLNTYITANNLYTLTNYSGADPEIGLGGDLSFIGVDRANTPKLKSFTMGLNISF
jgi:TonB-linked SusC/RagA family outer membrane protein